MARLAKRRAAICVILATAVLFGAAAIVASTARSPARPRVDSFTSRAPRQDLVPPAMRAVLAEPDMQLVAIVAADIDADGDLDVVASDTSLQLHVWVNDGAGHLRRVQPSRSSSLQPDPPGPTIKHGRRRRPFLLQRNARFASAPTPIPRRSRRHGS